MGYIHQKYKKKGKEGMSSFPSVAPSGHRIQGPAGGLPPAYLTSAIFLVLWNLNAPVSGSLTSRR